MLLSQKNPLAGDADISFDEPSHTYTVRGKRVPISVTKLGTQAVPPEHRFDGRKVITKNLRSWRSNASSKYHAMVADVDDDEAPGSADSVALAFKLKREAQSFATLLRAGAEGRHEVYYDDREP